MYKSFTPENHKAVLGLPEDYLVSGFLSYGTTEEETHFDKLHKTLDGLGIKYESRKLKDSLNHIYEITIDGKKYWLAAAYGGALLSEYLHLACLFGSKKNIHIGACGGLYPGLDITGLLIPSWSYGDESTTRIYARDSKDKKYFPDSGLSNLLKQKISSEIKVWNGPIMTCEAMFGETWEDIKSWSEEGFYGVEMETSTFFSVSNYFKVPAAALLYVIDNLIKGQTIGDQSYLEEEKLRDKIKNELCRAGLLTLVE
jgi:purine-nucleoside phosphorylase